MEIDPDSRARTHLANERTYLAWLRTGITLIALGLAAAQFLDPDVVPGVPLVGLLSTAVIAMGALTAAVGLHRYRTGARRIEEASFRPAGASLLVAALMAVAIALASIWFVWLMHPI